MSSYTLECQPGLGIEIKGAIEVFARQSSSVFPDCVANGFNYNYSKPFVDYCEAKGICTLSAAFLDAEKMFDAEPYYLPDNSYYLKPFRIDIFYDCSSKLHCLFQFFFLFSFSFFILLSHSLNILKKFKKQIHLKHFLKLVIHQFIISKIHIQQ